MKTEVTAKSEATSSAPVSAAETVPATPKKRGRKPHSATTKSSAGNGSLGNGSANNRKSNPSLAGLGKSGDAETNQRAATILEVLAGLRTPGQAAEALKISVNYYYVLERKALDGLVTACRPLPKGPPGKSPQRRLEELEQRLRQCQNENQRQAALVRATQRAVGLPAPAAPKPSGKPGAKGSKQRRRRLASVRALRVVDVLRKNSSLEKSTSEVEPNELPPTRVDSSPLTHSQEIPHGTLR